MTKSNRGIWPSLIAQCDSMRTLVVRPATFQQQRPTTGSIRAAATITFVPCFIVFLALRRDPVPGISMTAINQDSARPEGFRAHPAHTRTPRLMSRGVREQRGEEGGVSGVSGPGRR